MCCLFLMLRLIKLRELLHKTNLRCSSQVIELVVTKLWLTYLLVMGEGVIMSNTITKVRLPWKLILSCKYIEKQYFWCKFIRRHFFCKFSKVQYFWRKFAKEQYLWSKFSRTLVIRKRKLAYAHVATHHIQMINFNDVTLSSNALPTSKSSISIVKP